MCLGHYGRFPFTVDGSKQYHRDNISGTSIIQHEFKMKCLYK